MDIKQLRKEKGLTQAKCAEYLQIPIRSYKRYEANEDTLNKIKRDYILNRLYEYGFVDESHGKLTLNEIKNTCSDVFKNFTVDFCYLFGSYAKGKETEHSDVDLIVSVPLDGLKYYELVETLRERLKKKVDLIDVTQLNNNPVLLQEILKDGVKIYG